MSLSVGFYTQPEWTPYTLIETAKLNDVDPQGWLADTLARIPDCKITKVDDLLPWNMGSHHHMKDAA